VAAARRRHRRQRGTGGIAGDRPQREIRFGLVLYGGVSLAIYIYGVALEFARLVRASQAGEDNAYAALLREADASAIVDIVSGASAGGINGVLLGKALAAGGDIEAVRSLWVDEADIERLMHEPADADPRSLLRSSRFADLIADGL
jgi:predicted acylesterase/phospholipase RssA